MKITIEKFKERRSQYDYNLQPGAFICCRKNVIFKLYDTVLRSVDAGTTWTSVISSSTADVGAISADLLTVLIFDAVNLYRSTDGGETFSTTSLASLGITMKPYYSGIAFGTGYSNTNTVLFGEYGGAAGDYNVFRSADGGVTWASVLAKVNPTVIRHFHTMHYNPNDGNWYATSGDSDEQVHWWKSVDDGLTFTEIFDGSSATVNAQKYRTVGMVFPEDDTAIYASDDYEGAGSAVYSVKLSDITAITKLTDLPGIAYGIAQHGMEIVAVTTSGYNNSDKTAYVCVSHDSGKTWAIEGKWALADGKDTGGFMRIMGPTSKGEFLLYQVDCYSVLAVTRATIMTPIA